jgi:hypothetical protein
MMEKEKHKKDKQKDKLDMDDLGDLEPTFVPGSRYDSLNTHSLKLNNKKLGDH